LAKIGPENTSRGRTMNFRTLFLILPLIIPTLFGCVPQRVGPPPQLGAITLANPLESSPPADNANLFAAKNEWSSLVLQLDHLPAMSGHRAYSLRLHPLQLTTDNATIETNIYSAYQILPMPVDLNRAGFVRHTGQTAGRRSLPRALLPLPIDKGIIPLSNLHPLPDDAPQQLWIDLHIPAEARPGLYEAPCDLLQAGMDRPLARITLQVQVYDFVLSDERHLHMVSPLNWDTLMRLYPDRFEALTPRLMNRTDERYAKAVQTLDQLVELAETHRLELIAPRLQPTVKWPEGKPPQFDWADFDSLIEPWLKGEMFADRTPLGFWPLPEIDYLHNYNRASQLDYWSAAATHFDQMGWLNQTGIFMPQLQSANADPHDLSLAAAELLQSHPRVRVTIPLREDQVDFSVTNDDRLIPPRSGGRLMVAAPGLVFATPMRQWPRDVPRPMRWLRTDVPGLVPYVGAGASELDVRLWAWLASLRGASVILWPDPLPRTSGPDDLADPSDVVWFYPGSWFGVDKPLPSIQLKWLRQSQQDFEYLWLARQRKAIVQAILMARLIAKPVEIQPGQPADPMYALMCGATDPNAWHEARSLLARTILLHEPGQAEDEHQEQALNLAMLRWIEPQERPILCGRTIQWGFAPLDPANPSNQPGHLLDVRLGIDIYNASETRPDNNQLQWTALPPAWKIQPQPTAIPALATYQVRRFDMAARLDPDQIKPGQPQPVELTFTNGYTNDKTPVKMVLPVAASDRREGDLKLDGSLGEWFAADALQSGPMVRLLNRPALQRQQLQYSSTDSSLYSAWSQDSFYLGFKLDGLIDPGMRSTRNFVDYQFRRAWGEDLCEILLQPVYADNSTGPAVHLVAKPAASFWAETKSANDAWQPLAGGGIRYACTIEGSIWRGEMAIPWSLIADPAKGMPKLLRFNFTQHCQSTGQSASWAGPVDFGRDDALMGLLILRSPVAPGMSGNPR
jgi:hypothetical protein